MGKKRIRTIYDGLFEKNPVLISGLIAAPVIICTDQISNALLLCFAFSTVTFLSVMISSFVPKTWVYGIRIIVYTLIAALVYVPVSMLASMIFAEETASIGIYFPLLAVNSMITTQTEFLFDRRNQLTLLVSLLCYIVGFCVPVLVMSLLREFLAYGTIAGAMTGLTRLTPGIATPAGGFLTLALLSVLMRKLRILVRERRRMRR